MNTEDLANQPIGDSGVPYPVEVEVGDLITRLAELYKFNNGTTAAFFHVCAALSNHVGERLQ